MEKDASVFFPVTGCGRVEIFLQSGHPAFCSFCRATEATQENYLVSYSAIDSIAFAGSGDTGLRIAKIADRTPFRSAKIRSDADLRL
jgi:hypothetical protein